jgi:hypothetical protein
MLEVVRGEIVDFVDMPAVLDRLVGWGSVCVRMDSRCVGIAV